MPALLLAWGRLLAILCVLHACFPTGDAEGVPVIQPFTFPKNVSSGQDLKVICTVTAGGRPLVFQWLKDDRDLAGLPQTHVQSFDDFSVLTIKSAGRDHSGNYTCLAKNSHGKDAFNAPLSVLVSPYWMEESPSTVQVAQGRPAALHCKAQGHPKPRTTWSRKTSDSGGWQQVSEDGHFRLRPNGTLIISSARHEDAGTFECRVDNGVGRTLSKIVTLSVHVPVRFSERFEVKTVRRGDTAKLRCEASGDNPITITWSKNKDVITTREDSSVKFEVFESITSTGTSSELHIPAAERSDSAVYNCLARNHFGKDERTLKLVVLEVPSAPLDVRVEQAWSRSASVRWTAPFSGNSPITKFVIQYWRDAGAPHRLEGESVAPSQSSSLLKDLQPGTSYLIRVLAENEIGSGSPSETQRFTTKEEEPEASPTDVWLEARGAGALRVRWKPPPKDQWNGQLKGYYIGYKVQGSQEPFAYKTVDFGETLEEEYIVTGLLKNTAYSVVVKAFNNAGSGPSSPESVATTPDTDPPAAPSLWVESQTSSTVGLKWEQRPGPGGPVTHYTLHYQGEYGPWNELTIPATAGNKYTLTGLQEGARYQLYLTAVSEAGQSDPSDTLVVRTEGGALSDSSSYPVLGGIGGPGSGRRAAPFYLQLSVVVPVAVSAAIIVVVVTGACVYVKREQSRCKAVLAMRMAEKRLSYGGTMPHVPPSHAGVQRYSVEAEKAKPLLHPASAVHLKGPGAPLPPPGGYPAPYATLPLKGGQVDKHRLNADLKMRQGSKGSLLAQSTMEKVGKGPGCSIQERALVHHHYDVAA